jgi:radical SAM superfamily enzyme YgiQ (UPF0313 family)
MKLILVNTINAPQKIPPLSLAIIASLTPADWDIEIIDENFDEFHFKTADLVGITGFTHNAPRMYEIAAEYRKNNIKVVMGGIHASMVPDEAVKYVDAIVIGEAEGVWGDVIKDFMNNELKSVYKAELLGCDHWPIPRRDLFHPGYFFDAIQTTRGCPMCCDFCTVSSFNGNHYRQRPIEEIITELKTIKKRYIFFIDDNILGYGKKCEERALQLFKRMDEEKLDKIWYSFASINFADNEEILTAAAKCGCKMIFIGLESEGDAQLSEVNKNHNIKSNSHFYYDVVKKINRHKIAVLGGFIFGFDTDTRESILKRKRFLLKNRINMHSLAFLTPFPGTVFFDRLLKENRIIKNNYPEDWKLYSFVNLVSRPKNISPDELITLYVDIINSLLKRRNIIMRVLVAYLQSRSKSTALWVYNTNLNQRRRLLNYYKTAKAQKDKEKEDQKNMVY